ncbi:hypothetical protein [Paucidesulfovibrio longus]|uniref:hypothetical protein n=1 Tax=Paucidesulfovibrio longus TaxID=889 RepID=UPI0003B61161|nr:hypothetical protein [Paucidesulfovibrio longus]
MYLTKMDHIQSLDELSNAIDPDENLIVIAVRDASVYSDIAVSAIAMQSNLSKDMHVFFLSGIDIVDKFVTHLSLCYSIDVGKSDFVVMLPSCVFGNIGAKNIIVIADQPSDVPEDNDTRLVAAWKSALKRLRVKNVIGSTVSTIRNDFVHALLGLLS